MPSALPIDPGPPASVVTNPAGVIFRIVWLKVEKGFTHSLVHVKHLHDWLDHRIQATLEVGWHWKYGYCDPNEPRDSRGCWGFWRGHSGAAEEGLAGLAHNRRIMASSASGALPPAC